MKHISSFITTFFVICSIFLLFLIESCSINKNIFTDIKRTPLKKNEKIIVIWYKKFEISEGTEKVGSLHLKKNSLIDNNDIDKLTNEAKIEAASNGANIVVVTKFRPHFFPILRTFLKADLYFTNNLSNYEKILYWDSNRKLSWSDFKAEVPDSSTKFVVNPNKKYAFIETPDTLYNKKHFAYSEINIFFKDQEFSNNKYVSFINFFNCNKSWVVDSLKSDLALLHEQVHFDIVELYTRKFNQAILFNKIKNANRFTKGKDIFMKIYEEYKNSVKLYDLETQDGKEKNKQYEWYLKIYQELLGFPSY